MDEGTILTLIQDRGFHLLTPAHHASAGYSGLLVSIRPQPSGEHFDPEKVRLRLWDSQAVPVWTLLTLSTTRVASGHVHPGGVIVIDRQDRRVQFFTFGGDLDLIARPDLLVCVIRSPAPILALDAEQETVADQLASESEALLAAMEARWGRDSLGFQRRLAELDPLPFYVGCLRTLFRRYQQSQSLAGMYGELRQALFLEKEWLVTQGTWQANPAEVEDLLAPREAWDGHNR